MNATCLQLICSQPHIAVYVMYGVWHDC